MRVERRAGAQGIFEPCRCPRVTWGTTTRADTRFQQRSESRAEYRALTPSQSAALDAQRDRVGDLLREHSGVYRLPVLRGDLSALQQLLESSPGRPIPHADLKAIGVVFGDVLANELGLEWCEFTSSEDVQPALVTDHFTLTLFPGRTLSRHADDGEEIHLETLLDQIANHMQRLQNPRSHTTASSLNTRE
jgi:hypothetical protein